MSEKKSYNGATFSRSKIDWKAAQNYVQSWQRGQEVKWAGSKWNVVEVSDRGALLQSGSIYLEMNFVA